VPNDGVLQLRESKEGVLIAVDKREIRDCLKIPGKITFGSAQKTNIRNDRENKIEEIEKSWSPIDLARVTDPVVRIR